MKKILMVIFLIGALVIAGLVAFIFTFDLNRYRDKIEKQASATLGNPVKIGNLSLAWRQGLAVEIDGVQVLSNDEPVLKIQSAGAVLQVGPLLRRNIQIGSLFLDGVDVRVTKSSQGEVEIQGIRLPSAKNEVSDKLTDAPVSQETPATWTSFLIGKLDLKDIHIHYEDDTPAFPIQLDLRKIELSVKNVSFFRPMEFQAAAAIFGAKQNIHLSGRLKATESASEISVEDLKAEIDLNRIDLDDVARSFPKLLKGAPVTSIEGQLKADVEQLYFRNGKLQDFQADINLKDGKVAVFGNTSLVEALQVSVNRFRPQAPIDFKVQGAALSSESNFTFQGKLEMGNAGKMVVGPAQFDFDFNRLNWSRVQSFLAEQSLSKSTDVLASAPEGRIHADIRRLNFEPQRTPLGEVDFRYDQGRLRLKALPQELSQIHVTGNLRGDQLNLDAWNMSLGTSPAEGRLNIQSLFTAPVFRSEIKVRNMDLATMLPPQSVGQPSPEGVVSLDLSLSGRGKVAEVILPSLSGAGHFRVEGPVIRNLNVLQIVLEKLSAIPGVNDALNQRMSDKLKERLDRRDTAFNPIDQDFSISNQTIQFSGFELVSADLMLKGPADIRMDGVLQARPTIWIHEEIMMELSERVHELAFALNKEGRLQIPLTVSGKIPQLKVLPDIQFLLSEMVRNKSSQMMGQIAQRVAGGQGVGNMSQILGLKPYADEESVATTHAETESGNSGGNSESLATDNSVPVRVHSETQTQGPANLLEVLSGSTAQGTSGQSGNRKAQLAAGLLNSLLSSGVQSDSNSQSESGN